MLDRRGFIAGSAAAAAAATAAIVLPRRGANSAAADSIDAASGPVLRAAPAKVPLLGKERPSVDVWAYNGQVSGPELRVRQGERLRVILENRLSQETTIHWHGVRTPNAMDGVPHLTQPPVGPGQRFTYDFVVPDAGTFLYHPHVRSFEQVGRGLYGPLIVEEATPPRVDRELVWMLDDWRIGDNGQLSGGFGNRMDALMSGRIGNTVTINGRLPEPVAVRPNERIRLRLLNIANARTFRLGFGKLVPIVIAIDGQPVTPYEADEQILLGSGMRIDLILDCSGRPGDRIAITDSFYEGLESQLTSLVLARSPLRARRLTDSVDLRPNPLPEPVLAKADRHEVVFGGGMMGGGMMAGGGMMGGGGMMSGGGMMGWTVNGVSSTEHVRDPAFTVARGRTAILSLNNQTNWWHPIHLHGHSFRVLSRNGAATQRREWQDTVLLAPNEKAEIAFVADNPGDWMFHCHVLEHQAAGMMAIFRVA